MKGKIKCAFDEENKCTALKKKKCEGCNFYKTPEQLENERLAAFNRLKRLGISLNIGG